MVATPSALTVEGVVLRVICVLRSWAVRLWRSSVTCHDMDQRDGVYSRNRRRRCASRSTTIERAAALASLRSGNGRSTASSTDRSLGVRRSVSDRSPRDRSRKPASLADISRTPVYLRNPNANRVRGPMVGRRGTDGGPAESSPCEFRDASPCRKRPLRCVVEGAPSPGCSNYSTCRHRFSQSEVIAPVLARDRKRAPPVGRAVLNAVGKP